MREVSLTQTEFKRRCTAAQWETYVQGLITEAAERDRYYLKGGQLAFTPDVGGYQSNPTLVWNGTDEEWQEDNGSWYDED